MTISQFKQLSLALGLILLASLTYVVGTSLLFFSPAEQLEQTYFWVLAGFMPLGFVILPHLIAERYRLYVDGERVQLSWVVYLVFAVMIFLINQWFIRSTEFFHQLIIAFCEEYLFRLVIYQVLRQRYGYWSSIMISSILFGVVLHLNYPLLDNLLLRVPAGLFFSLLATKLGLPYAVAGHWLYNLIVSQVTF